MIEPWFQDYVLLAFRIDKALRVCAAQSPFVDYYYGPPAWKALIDDEPVLQGSRLVRDVNRLADALALQSFDSHRMAYLMKQVRAMETVCRKLAGETFSFEDEVQRCFDIVPTRIPEEQFEQAWASAEESLPGEGSLSERLCSLRRRYLLAPERSHLAATFLQRALTEARRRTQTFLSFPVNEQVHVQTVTKQTWSANNRYLGAHQSLIELNTDFPLNLRSLVETACHEDYPGHHKELTSLKRPFRETYAITYHAGKQLLPPWLQGLDRRAVFRRFLSEQIIPSELVHVEPLT